jgi:hypothetical protein
MSRKPAKDDIRKPPSSSLEEGCSLRIDHIGRILAESVELGKGGRPKNLKAYVRFYNSDALAFRESLAEKCTKTHAESDKEFTCQLDNSVFYFDAWDWGIVAYHTMDEQGTKEVEGFLKRHAYLRKPWIDKTGFEELSQEFEIQGGSIVGERGDFYPYDDYSGYDMTLEVRGARTEEVIGRMKKKYVLHPRKICFEFPADNGTERTKFEMFNDGRISFSSGAPESLVVVVARYANFIRNRDAEYSFHQSKKTVEDGLNLRQTFEVISLNLPSIRQIGVPRERRDGAIMRMLTAGGGLNGYIGMPIGVNRASIVDLREKKMLQVAIEDDHLYVYSENPSQVQSALRTLVANIARHIDPEVEVDRIKIGG